MRKLVIELDEELYQLLEEEAEGEGVSTEEFVVTLLGETFWEEEVEESDSAEKGRE